MKGTVKAICFYLLIVVIFGFIAGLSYICDNKWYSFAFILAAAAGLIYAGRRESISSLKMAGAWGLSLVIAVLSLIYGRPDLSVSFTGHFLNESYKGITQSYNEITGTRHIDYLFGTMQKPYDFTSWSAPEGYDNKLIRLSNAEGYLLTTQNSRHDKVVYHLHGGGYIATFTKNYNDTAVRYSKAYDGADLFSLNYRTAPVNLYPKALNDAVEGWGWLLAQGYKAENIIVAGDSAGGGLSLALTLKLRDTKQKLPRMLILSSPWTDLAAEGESYRTKIQADACFGTRDVSKAPRWPVSPTYAGNNDLHNPYISPAYADYTAMPPMLIQTGSEELLLSDSRTVAEKAKAAGVDVKFIEYKGMLHIFYIAVPGLEESKEAWKEIEIFIHTKK